ncbi:MAG: PASTA domain-containing protein [Chitinophagaceae bacterium]|nr:PASTA domain-containing protein [Chitinophagaceae bacterium]MCU0403123.1 PASTA domain-containing protein [Chitinophagaceae bacterium]
MFSFITRQHFLVNLLVAIALFLGIIFGFLSILKIITRHNQYEKVPAVAGKSYEEAVQILEDKGFNVEIQDSVWKPEIPPLQVISQSPAPDQLVKSHRLIFLTVNKSQPPVVEMPNLVGFSFRNALLYMDQLGLKLGDTTRKPDIARDAVLEQLYNGQDIRPGTRIFQGSTISFVLGSGLGEEESSVPDLYGMTFSEARIMLQTMGLNIGAIIADSDVKDTANGYIYRQYPQVATRLPDGAKIMNRIRVGQSIDLWLGGMPKPRYDGEETKDSLDINENEPEADE